ncbi:hypothetical protein L1987_06537 [Smallanthus sonchifolius]|uniref:Uncharacterized protein n=1 Tax=Smallanthus sonchifolius TaxID=185202 RepID=A0ACB9JYD2_9ASTR|nr:hypothetical protein L1987_06537 [Smallanthus sonchifolius]
MYRHPAPSSSGAPRLQRSTFAPIVGARRPSPSLPAMVHFRCFEKKEFGKKKKKRNKDREVETRRVESDRTRVVSSQWQVETNSPDAAYFSKIKKRWDFFVEEEGPGTVDPSAADSIVTSESMKLNRISGENRIFDSP